MEKYKIGDRVITGAGEEVTAASSGFLGRNNEIYYVVEKEDGSMGCYSEKDLKPCDDLFDPAKMSFKITVEDNLAIARTYYDGKEIEKGHGHIFHDGIEGVLQSVSYAFRRMWLHYTGQEEG